MGELLKRGLVVNKRAKTLSRVWTLESGATMAEINEKLCDQVRGSLIGGAIGDALGYAVEFDRESTIFSMRGKDGITEYDIDSVSGKALISDDTQMTLFTIDGILGFTEEIRRGDNPESHNFIYGMTESYLKWYRTQIRGEIDSSYLQNIPELFCRRMPGNTCMKALDKRARVMEMGYDGNRNRSRTDDDLFWSRWEPLKYPINDSKGCGGIMRVAPYGLFHDMSLDIKLRMKEVAEISAITHGHPLGFMPGAVVCHIISQIVYGEEEALKMMVLNAKNDCKEVFKDYEYLDELMSVIDKAIELSENSDSDLDNIHKIGEGWVAEETLGIALYCALKYENDFDKAIITAVNHNGDSDSTGAVTGNIMGALYGLSRISEKWTKDLELYDVIIDMADDLVLGKKYINVNEEPPVNSPWYMRQVLHQTYKASRGPGVDEYTFFWHEDEENGYLNNWYPAKFKEEYFIYDSSEQYIMAEKARFFGDSETYTKILKANSPSECKKLGRKVSNFDEEKWERYREYAVMGACRLKFNQNPMLKAFLLATGDSYIAEASPYDKIWGIGLSKEEAEKIPKEEWPGKNLLGSILMKLRIEFRSPR